MNATNTPNYQDPTVSKTEQPTPSIRGLDWHAARGYRHLDQWALTEMPSQRRYELRMRAQSRCIICGRKSPGFTRCKRHRALQRAANRRKGPSEGRKAYNAMRRAYYRFLRLHGHATDSATWYSFRLSKTAVALPEGIPPVLNLPKRDRRSLFPHIPASLIHDEPKRRRPVFWFEKA